MFVLLCIVYFGMLFALSLRCMVCDVIFVVVIVNIAYIDVVCYYLCCDDLV